MCIDDKRKRRDLVLQLNGPQVTIDLSIPDTHGMAFVELAGFQFSGVPVIAGVPYSMGFYVSFNNTFVSSDMLATNNGTAMAGMNGTPCQLQAAYTNQLFDTPRRMATRVGSLYLPTGTRMTIEVRDETGQLAQFSAGRIYCNLVYEVGEVADMQKGIAYQHRMTYAEHIPSSYK